MIINFLLNVLVLFIGAIFSWLPQVETIPSIVGYDIDTALVNGVGQMRSIMAVIWPLSIAFSGFLVLLGYFAIKQVIRFFLGSRAP